MEIKGEALALACARAADGIKAEDIRVLDVRGLSNLTDYLVVCSAMSQPQMRGILREVSERVAEDHGVKPVYSEGNAGARWVVLDYIDVMVHVLDQELRDFYRIEELWKDGKEISGWNESPAA